MQSWADHKHSFDAPNWAGAAANVGVSASALSQGPAELEYRVGFPLFDREGRRRTLRPGAGEALFPDGSHTRAIVVEALQSPGARLQIVAESVVQRETGPDALANGRVIACRDLVTTTLGGAATDPAVQLLLASLSA